MCGGTSTTTQQVSIPQDVLNRYNSVNAQAEQVAQTPFQQYSTDPNAFVAPLTETQQAGIAGTNAAAGQAQPYFDAAQASLYQGTGQGYAALGQGMDRANALQGQAAGNIAQGLAAAQPYNAQAQGLYYQGLGAAQPLYAAANQNISGAQASAQPYQGLATSYALQGAQAVDPSALTGQAINSYLSPYLSTVLGTQQALQNQQMQQAVSGSLGDAIRSGAFGGDRAGIAAANVAQQLQLANNAANAQTLNTGYGQALSTAQQQQQLGLGAAQANRAALAGASPQLAAIGQQGFGQGLATAQAQQGLGGAQAGLYQGTGTNLQGLGQQLYGQYTGTGGAQANLGNQEFNQGLQAAQQYYNMGSGNANTLAGLGTGAQSAALQGAQAQLAAGQQQQQTQQAGLTALYNQFLQQQSYPFQVAQFLANIAEGTGALSGSTTTTTQPAGFFSDRRLKTDVKKVGETFDGQPIYSFKYKGDDRTQIGLMAQDVEKTHPDAVGKVAGLGVVDYGKATDKAAEKGKFYRGGLVPANENLHHANDEHYAAGGLAGFDPELAQQMLANSGGFGPYMSSAGGPYGGLGRVPKANLPVHAGLMLPGKLPAAPSSGMSQLRSAVDLGEEAAGDFDTVKKGLGSLGKHGGAGGFTRDADLPDDYARGGFALGGDSPMPYEEQIKGPGLDIPDQQPDVHELQTPGMPSKGKSGLGQIIGAAKTAAEVAKFAAMFKQGGRVGYDDGGVIDDADAGAGDDRPFDVAKLDLRGGLKPVTIEPRPEIAAPAPAGLGAAAPAESAALPAPTGLAPPAEAVREPPLKRAAEGVKDKVNGASHHPEIWVPLLSGLAAMGSAPTGNFGAALAQGLGAGARSWLSTKAGLAEIAREQALTEEAKQRAAVEQARVPVVGEQLNTQRAQTGLVGSQTESQRAAAALTRQQANNELSGQTPAGYIRVPGVGPSGEHFTGADGLPYHYALQANVTDFGGAPATPGAERVPVAPQPKAAAPLMSPSSDTDAYVTSQFHVTPGLPGVANHARALALNPELAPLDAAAHNAVQKRVGDLQENENTRRNFLQLSEAVNDLGKGTLAGQGYGSGYRTKIANFLGTVAQFVGVPLPPDMTKDRTNQEIIAKIKELAGPALASRYGEKAASVSHAITGVLPGGDLTPAAANEILAQMLVGTQQPRDLAQYANNYAGKYGLMAGVEQGFQRDTAAAYNREQRALPAFMSSSAFKPALADLNSGDPAVRARAVKALDGKYGPGFSRYFIGN